jgi:hypothetical protein
LPDDEWDGTSFCGIVVTEYMDERVGLRTMVADNLPKGDSVVDSGAYTMKLGAGWHFTDHQTGHFVNVRGFDATCSKRNGIRIGTAATVMREDNHPNARRCLLSRG